MKTNKYWIIWVISLILSVSPGVVWAQSLDDILNDVINSEQMGNPSPTQNDGFDWNYQAENTDLKSSFYEYSRFLDSKSLNDLGMFENINKNLPGNNKIATSLRLLMNQEKSLDVIGFEEKAFSLGVEAVQQQVYVTITAESVAQSKSIESSLVGEFITQFENKTYAILPISELETLAENGSVYSIEPQAKFYPLTSGRTGKIVSEGVQSINASHLHKANITGKGVKVGILDFGFDRYNELQQKGEVSAPIAARAFGKSGKLENGNVHGTACAEIIYDIAPDASIYLAQIDGNIGDLIKAALWLAEQDVDIINFSGGGHNGPHNGTSPFDILVEYITKKYDVLWVNAAGNEGDKHLPLILEDKNNNQLIDINFNGKQYDFAIVTVYGGGVISLGWDDWGSDPSKPSSTQDLDMYLGLFDPKTKKFKLVEKSKNAQNGRASPIERIYFKKGKYKPGTKLYLSIVKKNASRRVAIHLHTEGVKLSPSNPVGSIGIPATSPKALAVGAVDVRSNKLEAFSSQGPTDDGRMKPDVSAPDNNLSMAYGEQNKPGRFPGTSAACPHVSGFAALLHQHYKQPNQLKLRQLVEKNVRFLNSNSPNNLYGKGYISARAIKVGAGQSTPSSSESDISSPDDPVNELQHALDDILSQ